MSKKFQHKVNKLIIEQFLVNNLVSQEQFNIIEREAAFIVTQCEALNLQFFEKHLDQSIKFIDNNFCYFEGKHCNRAAFESYKEAADFVHSITKF